MCVGRLRGQSLAAELSWAGVGGSCDASSAAAREAGVPASTLIRQSIEAHLAALADDQPVSCAEVIKMVGMLRPVPDAGDSAVPHAA